MQDRPDSAFYLVGVIPKYNPNLYISLLTEIAGKEFSFDPKLDDEAKKLKVAEWKQWWEKEGKHQKLNLEALKERCDIK